MKKLVIELNIALFGVFLLTACTAGQAAWKLEKKLNPKVLERVEKPK